MAGLIDAITVYEPTADIGDPGVVSWPGPIAHLALLPAADISRAAREWAVCKTTPSGRPAAILGHFLAFKRATSVDSFIVTDLAASPAGPSRSRSSGILELIVRDAPRKLACSLRYQIVKAASGTVVAAAAIADVCVVEADAPGPAGYSPAGRLVHAVQPAAAGAARDADALADGPNPLMLWVRRVPGDMGAMPVPPAVLWTRERPRSASLPSTRPSQPVLVVKGGAVMVVPSSSSAAGDSADGAGVVADGGLLDRAASLEPFVFPLGAGSSAIECRLLKGTRTFALAESSRASAAGGGEPAAASGSGATSASAGDDDLGLAPLLHAFVCTTEDGGRLHGYALQWWQAAAPLSPVTDVEAPVPIRQCALVITSQWPLAGLFLAVLQQLAIVMRAADAALSASTQQVAAAGDGTVSGVSVTHGMGADVGRRVLTHSISQLLDAQVAAAAPTGSGYITLRLQLSRLTNPAVCPSPAMGSRLALRLLSSQPAATDIRPSADASGHALSHACTQLIARCSLPDPRALPLALGASFSMLLRCLSPRNVVVVLQLLLLEQRIIMHTAHEAAGSILTGVGEALLTLLFPLSWQAPFIPVCPAGLGDIVDCPTSYLVGMHTSLLPLAAEYSGAGGLSTSSGVSASGSYGIRRMPDDVFVVDLDADRVTPPTTASDMSAVGGTSAAGGEAGDGWGGAVVFGPRFQSHHQVLSPQVIVPPPLRKHYSASDLREIADAATGKHRLSTSSSASALSSVHDVVSDIGGAPQATVSVELVPIVLPLRLREQMESRLLAASAAAGFRPGMGVQPGALSVRSSAGGFGVQLLQPAVEEPLHRACRDAALRLMCVLLASYRDFALWVPATRGAQSSAQAWPPLRGDASVATTQSATRPHRKCVHTSAPFATLDRDATASEGRVRRRVSSRWQAGPAETRSMSTCGDQACGLNDAAHLHDTAPPSNQPASSREAARDLRASSCDSGLSRALSELRVTLEDDRTPISPAQPQRSALLPSGAHIRSSSVGAAPLPSIAELQSATAADALPRRQRAHTADALLTAAAPADVTSLTARHRPEGSTANFAAPIRAAASAAPPRLPAAAAPVSPIVSFLRKRRSSSGSSMSNAQATSVPSHRERAATMLSSGSVGLSTPSSTLAANPAHGGARIGAAAALWPYVDDAGDDIDEEQAEAKEGAVTASATDGGHGRPSTGTATALSTVGPTPPDVGAGGSSAVASTRHFRLPDVTLTPREVPGRFFSPASSPVATSSADGGASARSGDAPAMVPSTARSAASAGSIVSDARVPLHDRSRLLFLFDTNAFVEAAPPDLHTFLAQVCQTQGFASWLQARSWEPTFAMSSPAAAQHGVASGAASVDAPLRQSPLTLATGSARARAPTALGGHVLHAPSSPVVIHTHAWSAVPDLHLSPPALAARRRSMSSSSAHALGLLREGSDSIGARAAPATSSDAAVAVPMASPRTGPALMDAELVDSSMPHVAARGQLQHAAVTRLQQQLFTAAGMPARQEGATGSATTLRLRNDSLPAASSGASGDAARRVDDAAAATSRASSASAARGPAAASEHSTLHISARTPRSYLAAPTPSSARGAWHTAGSKLLAEKLTFFDACEAAIRQWPGPFGSGPGEHNGRCAVPPLNRFASEKTRCPSCSCDYHSCAEHVPLADMGLYGPLTVVVLLGRCLCGGELEAAEPISLTGDATTLRRSLLRQASSSHMCSACGAVWGPVRGSAVEQGMQALLRAKLTGALDACCNDGRGASSLPQATGPAVSITIATCGCDTSHAATAATAAALPAPPPAEPAPADISGAVATCSPVALAGAAAAASWRRKLQALHERYAAATTGQTSQHATPSPATFESSTLTANFGTSDADAAATLHAFEVHKLWLLATERSFRVAAAHGGASASAIDVVPVALYVFSRARALLRAAAPTEAVHGQVPTTATLTALSSMVSACASILSTAVLYAQQQLNDASAEDEVASAEWEPVVAALVEATQWIADADADRMAHFHLAGLVAQLDALASAFDRVGSGGALTLPPVSAVPALTEPGGGVTIVGASMSLLAACGCMGGAEHCVADDLLLGAATVGRVTTDHHFSCLHCNQQLRCAVVFTAAQQSQADGLLLLQSTRSDALVPEQASWCMEHGMDAIGQQQPTAHTAASCLWWCLRLGLPLHPMLEQMLLNALGFQGPVPLDEHVAAEDAASGGAAWTRSGKATCKRAASDSLPFFISLDVASGVARMAAAVARRIDAGCTILPPHPLHDVGIAKLSDGARLLRILENLRAAVPTSSGQLSVLHTAVTAQLEPLVVSDAACAVVLSCLSSCDVRAAVAALLGLRRNARARLAGGSAVVTAGVVCSASHPASTPINWEAGVYDILHTIASVHCPELFAVGSEFDQYERLRESTLATSPPAGASHGSLRRWHSDLTSIMHTAGAKPTGTGGAASPPRLARSVSMSFIRPPRTVALIAAPMGCPGKRGTAAVKIPQPLLPTAVDEADAASRGRGAVEEVLPPRPLSARIQYALAIAFRDGGTAGGTTRHLAPGAVSSAVGGAGLGDSIFGSSGVAPTVTLSPCTPSWFTSVTSAKSCRLAASPTAACASTTGLAVATGAEIDRHWFERAVGDALVHTAMEDGALSRQSVVEAWDWPPTRVRLAIREVFGEAPV